MVTDKKSARLSPTRTPTRTPRSRRSHRERDPHLGHQPHAPGIAGRTEYNPLPDHEPGTTDTAKAKALLEEAGAVGYEIKWLFANDDPASVKAKDVVVKSLEAAGFKASPVCEHHRGLLDGARGPEQQEDQRP